MTKTEKILLSIVVLLTLATLIFWKDIMSISSSKTKVDKVGPKEDKKKDKKDKKSKDDKDQSNTMTSPELQIVQKWELPSDLKEVSGIAYIKDIKLACVQDEIGKIFIYNTDSKKVEKEIEFAGVGDYEGITVVNTTAYIIRADGNIFEVQNYNANKPSVVEHSTL